MNFHYVPARIFARTTGFNWTSATIKALAVMANSTANIDKRATFLTGVSGFANLDEFDGAGYSRQTLTGITITDDLATDDLIFNCDIVSFGATISNGTRSVKGYSIYLDGANDGARRPLIWLDSVANGQSFPFLPNGGPMRIVPGTRGLFRDRSKSV